MHLWVSMPQRAFNSAMQVIVEVYTLKVSVYQSLQFRSIQKCHFAEVVANFAWPFGPDVWPFGFWPSVRSKRATFRPLQGIEPDSIGSPTIYQSRDPDNT